MVGKAGCGKTVLCSTVIEDIRAYCETKSNSWLAAFYFTFSDNQKQTYEKLLRSIVAQLGWKEPSLAMLRQAYEKSSLRVAEVNELEEIFRASVEAHNEVFLLLDALDECPEADAVRQEVLERIERLAQSAPKLKLLATSRELLDVRDSMSILGADEIAIATSAVDADICMYVSSELSRDRKLARLDLDSKVAVEKTIARKADGMFRWAYCQLHELKRLKCFSPSFIRKALHDLPPTLDETYTRMLTGIEKMYRKDAITLLQWLAYARWPLTLGELVDAVIIDPAEDGVDFDDRGDVESTLVILSGLVTTIGPNDSDQEGDVSSPNGVRFEYGYPPLDDSDSESNAGNANDHHVSHRIAIRLAHFSVKEYLGSSRILESGAREYHLDPARAHRFLKHSCLAYIRHYSNHCDRTSTREDLVRYPLLRHAAWSWSRYSSLQQNGDASLEVSLLTSHNVKRAWLLMCHPDQPLRDAFDGLGVVGSALYYASLLGLEAAVSTLLDSGANINAQGDYLGKALQAASSDGHERVVQILLDAGADVNADGGYYGNALQAASLMRHENVVQMLLDAGADVNAHGECYGYALQAASARENVRVVQMLLDAGANVNAQGGHYGNALRAARYLSDSSGYESAELLIEQGADVNGGALQMAARRNRLALVELLLDRGADINRRNEAGSALEVARQQGNIAIVALLKARGAHET